MNTVEADLLALLECLAAQMGQEGLPDPCFLGMLPGEAVPLNYCDNCGDGMAWVRLVAIGAPTDADPQAAGSTCYNPLAATVEVGIIRGIVVIHEDGSPATPDEQMTAFREQMAGMRAMHRTLTCCDLPSGESIGELNYTPMGPEGGCVGGTFTGTIRIT